MGSTWRQRLANWIAPPRRLGTRAYSGARPSRLTASFGLSSGNSSADTELLQGLAQLRTRSRQLIRDAPYAKHARAIVVNNVIGTGVGMQCQVMNTRGQRHERINSDIETAWDRWARAASCHTGGTLHFSDLERACMGEVFVAGEVFLRKHFRAFGESQVAIALELIEAERIADEYSIPGAGANSNVRMGIETDEFGRPTAYWIRDRHPGELRLTPDQNKITRVPADQIIHLKVVDRWPQTRGEPWLHAVLRKLADMEEYSGAELVAARMSANYFATIESPEEDPLPGVDKQDDGQKHVDIEPGVIEQLLPGDELKFHTPNRPNTALDPFMRYMLREVAIGIAGGISYDSFAGDFSQSNYSSSRLARLDERDVWRVLQQWWVRTFREPFLRDWLQQAVLSRAITSVPVEQYAVDRERFEAASWKLRGWTWHDPTKEVDAYMTAVRAGFTTVGDVIAATGGGRDLEDVIRDRRRELDLFAAEGIEVDTTVTEEVKQSPAASEPAADSDGDNHAEPEDGARILKMKVTA